ncbi:MAG: hypothetical protein K8S87_00820 [Planctomycetes bacterium]|nr:hypothetical protein [Planctomycetota bacterium]
MKSKINKSFIVFVVLMLISGFSGITFAANEPAEVIASPSEIEAGKSEVIVYLLGLNSQLFSHSSIKEPTVDADNGITIKEFRVLSPKRAQITIDTASETVGAVQLNLKFYDTAGEKVVKSCVFYINVLGPKTVSDIVVTLYSIPRILLGQTNIQRTGTFELEGVINGKITITLPSNLKFLTDLIPRITSLSVDATVDNIKVSETGDNIEFDVQNPENDNIKLLLSDIFIDTSGASEGEIKGDIYLQIYSSSFSDTVIVPVGHTPGYTIADEEELNSENDNKSSNSSTNSGSGYSNYNTNNSSNNTDENDENTKNNENNDSSQKTYNGGGFITSFSSSGRSSRGNFRSNNPSSQRLNGSSGNYRIRRPANSATKNAEKKNTDKKSEDGVSFNNFKKKINVAPANDGKFKILQIAFCNISFDKKAAIPLRATNAGFEAELNIEIRIEMVKENPDSFEVIVSVGETNTKTIELKHIRNGVYRSSQVHKFSISYEDVIE